MSQALPLCDFKFLTDDEIQSINFLQIADDASTGFVIECDLMYPEELHSTHNDFPLASENVLVTESMLSLFCKSFDHKTH